MQQLVTPIVPFPNLYWWSVVLEMDDVIFDKAEHFVKMTYRNRYYITGANGLIQLTIPLAQGRNQRTAMADLLIDNKDDWQKQHWRTIMSVYGRAPYFEHYGVELERFYTQPYKHITDFNIEVVKWLKKQLGVSYKELYTDTYAEYADYVMDIRKTFKPGREKTAMHEEMYYQVFSERNGFYPNLSILDLLMSEGPAATSILQQNKEEINSWG